MKKLLPLALILFLGISLNAQIEAPQPSPFGRLEQKVGLTDITVEYSRPGMHGRKVFGDLVPYGQLWRTGANENTRISFSDDVKINGMDLKKGSYAIYTIPSENSWEVIFYTTTNNWGVPQQWEEKNVALKTTAQTVEMPVTMETFTILIDDLKNSSASLNFIWEETIAMLTIEVPTDARTMASIEKVMNGPSANDYFAAASYYHDSGKDLEKAYEWIVKATEAAGDQAFWMLRRQSLIEAEMGKTKAAIATAKRSLVSAEKAKNADYVKMNKESIAEWETNK